MKKILKFGLIFFVGFAIVLAGLYFYNTYKTTKDKKPYIETLAHDLIVKNSSHYDFSDHEKELVSAITSITKQKGSGNAVKALFKNNMAPAISFTEMLFKQIANLKNAQDYGAFTFLNEPEKSIDAYKKVVSLTPKDFESWDNLGFLYLRLGKAADAKSAYEEELKVGQELNNKIVITDALTNIGTSALVTGDSEEAMFSYQQALALCQEIGNKEQEASLDENIATVYLLKEDSKSAQEWLEKALMLDKESNNRKGQARRLTGLGALATAKQEIQQAIGLYEEALKINIEINNKKMIAVNYENLGNCHFFLNEFPKAIEYYNKAIWIKDDIGGLGIAAIYENLGLVYGFMEDLVNSKNMYYKSLEIYKNQNDSVGIARVLKSIGNLELAQGNFKKAKEIHSTAINMDKKNVQEIERKMKLLKGEVEQ